ncbi:MAG: methyl-accepting chemotaxis protein [Thalassobaculales bacterium]
MVVSGVYLLGGLRDLRAVQRLTSVNTATDLLLQSAENLTNERGLTQTALNAAAPLAADRRQPIQARRDAMMAAYAAAVRGLEGEDFPERRQRLQQLAAAVDRVEQLRRSADAALAEPRERRDAQLLRDWYPAATTAIERIGQVWQAAAGTAVEADGAIVLANDVKAYAMLMREYAGRERATLGGGVGGQVAAVASRAQDLTDWRARADLAWTRLIELTQDDRAGAAVSAAIARARASFHERYGPQRDSVMAALLAGQRAALTPAQWAEASNPALQSIVDIRDAAIAASREHLDARASAAWLAILLGGATLLAGLVAAGFCIAVVTRRVVGPLARLADVTGRLAAGDLAVEVQIHRRADEIGRMAEAVGVFRENLVRVKELDAAQRTAQAAKEARQRAIEEQIGRFDGIVSRALDTIVTQAGDTSGSAGTLANVAGATLEQSRIMSSLSDQALASVRTATSEAEALSASIADIGRQAQAASSQADDAVRQAEATDRKVRGLAEAAQRIGDVVKLISDIAAQTNLLALNATIEAARAGEAGRGFSVVAAEVKNLATQTGRATEDIAQQIAGIQGATNEAVQAIRAIGNSIVAISEVAGSIAQAVSHQDSSTREIARNVRQVAEGTHEVAGSIADVARSADQSGKAAESMVAATNALIAQVDGLRSEVRLFFGQIKAV